MSGRDQMTQLAELAAMVRDRELAKVEKIVREMSRLRSDIARLDEARTARAAGGTLDAARLSGVERMWLGWSDEEIRRRQTTLAGLRARHEVALAEARSAFGRAEVARRLSEER